MLFYSSVRKVDTLRTESEIILFDTRAGDNAQFVILLVALHGRQTHTQLRTISSALVLKCTILKLRADFQLARRHVRIAVSCVVVSYSFHAYLS